MTGGNRFQSLAVGDTVKLRRPHPCGGYDWEVARVGTDIGLVCSTCRHKIFLPREEMERRCVARSSSEGAGLEKGIG